MRNGYLLAATYFTLILFVCCDCDRKTATATQGEAHSENGARSNDINYRETQAIESIMGVFDKHSGALRANVEARFTPSGKVLACKVELRESIPFSRRNERKEIIREICAIVEKLGRPTPPPSLTFEVSFSTPLVVPEGT